MSEPMKVQITVILIIFAITVYGLITTAVGIYKDMEETEKREREEKRLAKNKRGDRKGT